ncbi:hypothetical protein [Pontibacter mangrovi]|uniref:Uncharacterized protein n=1 Tax=Pontibacter mangrovi TaxID=2589816 RepID=A0A501WB19_9BACT|nr:hypothetical protein [Pontibacter mangrovi]TPE44007.1 hypothetical protein FJM65_11330 [Pontibacter mangrovi]
MLHVRFLLLVFFVGVAVPLLAQKPAQPLRLELPLEPENTEVSVIALPDSSLLVYHKLSNAWETESMFYFTKYNSQLEEVWSDTVDIAADNDYLRYYNSAPYTYMVFGRDNLREYTFVRLDHRTGSTWHKQFELEQLEDIYEYNVLNGKFFIIGRNRKDGKPMLLHLNPQTGEYKPLPSIYGEQSSFADLLTDADYGRVDAVISESNGRVSRLQVKSFDADGELLNNYFVLQKEGTSLLNAEITPGDSTEKLLLGTYGTRDLRYAQGFFAAPLASRVVTGNFYNLLQLRNFLKYMKPRREARTRRREEKRLESGRSKGMNYRLLLHDLLPTSYGYVLVAEAYYLQYDNPQERHTALDIDGEHHKMPRGIKRTHAVALGFDKNGTLLWDNTFPLAGLTTYIVAPAVEAQALPDGRMVMAYPDDSSIFYQVMDDVRYDRDQERQELELQPYEENEKILFTQTPGIIRWYGNHMAAFGFQRIRGRGDVRTVFYINKITF